MHRRDLATANWGSLTYMLSAFAVISFTSNWAYVMFAALGAWIGTYATMKYLRWRSARDAQRDGSAAAAATVCAEATADVVAARSAQALPITAFPAGERIAA